MTPDGELARTVAREGRSAAALEAEAELCRRFAPRIRLYGLKHLGDEDRARDLVQSVLLAMLVALRERRVDDVEHLDRFVLGTCRNLALRARHERARAEPRDVGDLDRGVILPQTDAVDFGALVRCMAALEVRAQTVLQLTFYREESAETIARLLETTPGNVRVLRHRAMAQLRDCMDGGRE